MAPLALIAASGLLVGSLLGALGAGGSVVTVPILVYLLGEDVPTAATTSLLVVGLTAATGAVSHARAGSVRLPTALALSAVASLGSAAGSVLRARVDGRSFLLGFAFLLVVAAAAIWRPAGQGEGGPRECVLRPDARACTKLGASGLAVGLLTGFFGVGGGFVIVAVLLAVLAFPAREAIGTSLVVVALASAMGLAASLRQAAIDWPVAIPFALAGAVGASYGRRLTRRVDDRTLRRAFAVILLGLSVFLAARNLRAPDTRASAHRHSEAARRTREAAVTVAVTRPKREVRAGGGPGHATPGGQGDSPSREPLARSFHATNEDPHRPRSESPRKGRPDVHET